MQTDKAMEPISCGPDVTQWNSVFEVYRKELGGAEPTWFSVSWLFAECFMYRKIADIIQSRLVLVQHNSNSLAVSNSSLLKDVDPFASQKQDSFRAILPQLKTLASFVLELLNKQNQDTRMEFQHLLLVSICMGQYSGE